MFLKVNGKAKEIVWFIILCLLGGILSILLGQDVSFDLRNYHLYQPYALLNSRFGFDIIPAGIHTYFNPIIDVPYYLSFVLLQDFPRINAFLQGIWYGGVLCLAWKLVNLFFPGKSAEEKFLRWLSFLMGVSGVALISQIGRGHNEVPLAFLNLCAAYLLLKKAPADSAAPKYWAGAAFLTGLCAGLKYTSAPVAVGAGIAGLYLWKKGQASWKSFFGCALAGFGGFALSNGYFMWRLFHYFNNPFFPFFNGIFKSPFFLQENLPNGFAAPGSIKDWFILPFQRIYTLNPEVFLDLRIVTGVCALIILTIWGLYNKKKSGLNVQENSYRWYVVSFLFIGAGISWWTAFGVMRYSAIVAFWGSILTVGVLLYLLGRTKATIVSLFLFLVMLHYPSQGIILWDRENTFSDKNLILSSAPQLQDDSLVVLVGHMSFLIPFLNPTARYIGGHCLEVENYPDELKSYVYGINWLQPADYQHRLWPQIQTTIEKHQGELYVLADKTPLIFHEATLEPYGLYIENPETDCQKFHSNIQNSYTGYQLCRAKRR